MKKVLVFICLFYSVVSFSQSINPKGNTVAERFVPMKGYVRQAVKPNSFAEFLRKFPLKPNGTKVLYFDGREKPNQIQLAVLDIDRGPKDLQQCADAVMRLRAEYLFTQNRFGEIHFKNFGGTSMDWERYAQGYRIGNKGYQKTAKVDASAKAFRSYLDMVFNYANTFTLEKELRPKKIEDLNIGDVFIVSNPKSYGHAMLVMDVAINETTKDKIFLLAQSYMPAQDIHVVKNPVLPQNLGWFSVQDISAGNLTTPEWTFPINALRTFD
jgi:hypothetical protein